jgi:hypothetical protein
MPRYRTKRTIAINGLPYAEDMEVSFDGWPKAHELEPIDVGAKRIADYASRNQFQPFLPKTPYNPITGSPQTEPEEAPSPPVSGASSLGNPAQLSRLVVGELPSLGKELGRSHGNAWIVLIRNVLCQQSW